MTEFTPGPWLIEYDNHGNGGFSEWWNVGPAAVLISRKNKDQAAVDAFLIAAAPDLLAALEDALYPFNQPTRNPGGMPVGEPDWCKAARAAIVKAYGTAAATSPYLNKPLRTVEQVALKNLMGRLQEGYGPHGEDLCGSVAVAMEEAAAALKANKP